MVFASRRDREGKWKEAIHLYRLAAETWPEQSDYVENYVAAIELKMIPTTILLHGVSNVVRMLTPIVYGHYLYSCSNNGMLTCYKAVTGKEVCKKRMRAPRGSLAFSASPLAADGHLYFFAEEGRCVVVKAVSEYEIVATNNCNGSIHATPAISDGEIFVRTRSSLIAVGE